jgi:hypothetical protein
MKKFLFSIMTVILLLLPLSAETEDERVASILNYVQYSTCKIIESQNKGLLESEFSDILNNIEPSSLKNRELIDQYNRLLSTLTSLKLSQNQKAHLEEKIVLERKNAVFNSLNSFGSVLYLPSKDPVSLAISLAYAGVSAGFNYARTINEIEIEHSDESFKLAQQDLRTIDDQRASLFANSATIYSTNEYNSKDLIAEEEMKTLAIIASKLDSAVSDTQAYIIANQNKPSLEIMETKFAHFIPFWLVLGKTYRLTKNYKKANDAFNHVYQLSENSSILRTNPYVREAAKQNILLCMDTKSKNISTFINYITTNTLTDQMSQDDLAYLLYSTYLYLKDYNSAEKELSYLKQRGLETEISQLTCSFNILHMAPSSLVYKQSEAMFAYLNTKFYKHDGKVYIDCPFEITGAYISTGRSIDKITNQFIEKIRGIKEGNLEIEKIITKTNESLTYCLPKLKYSTLNDADLSIEGDERFIYVVHFDKKKNNISAIMITNEGNCDRYDISSGNFVLAK